MISGGRTSTRIEREWFVLDLVRDDGDSSGVVQVALGFEGESVGFVGRERGGRTFHPSTHIAPRDKRETVPSPSPKTTPASKAISIVGESEETRTDHCGLWALAIRA